MKTIYNIGEVFEIAEQIERNGAKFYRKAAKLCQDSAGKELLITLANEEDGHEKTFRELKNENCPEEQQEQLGDLSTQLYLKALASKFVFVQGDEDDDVLQGCEEVEKILEIAMERECDAILFYSGLKHAVIHQEDHQKLDLMIQEEQKHFASLSEYLAEYKKS